jgi:lysophospholipase L1-like esterase
MKSKLLRVAFFLSLAINLVAAAYFVRKVFLRSQTNTAAAPAKPAYYLERDKLFDVLPKDSNTIVFLGNSLTQYFELAEILNNNRVRNRGIHGDMITGVLNRLSPIIASQPEKIFIEIGINDLEQRVSKEQLLMNYERLVDTLKNSCSKTKLYIQSLLPVSDSCRSLYNYCSPQMNKLVKEVNQELQQLASKKGCTYIDVHAQMLKANELNPAYSVDGVHLSGEGYLQWAKVIKPFVEE